MTAKNLTYMDCWHYIAPLIPVTDAEWTQQIYIMVFKALNEAEERREEVSRHAVKKS